MSAHEGQIFGLSNIAALCLFWNIFCCYGLSSRPGNTIFSFFLTGGQIVSCLLWSPKFKLLDHGPMHIKSLVWATVWGQPCLAKHRPWEFFLLCKMMTISLIWGIAVVVCCCIWVIFGIRRRYEKNFLNLSFSLFLSFFTFTIIQFLKILVH